MISFFRKTRQQAMSENESDRRMNKTGAYLLYAIGEIVLVSIGDALMQIGS